MTRIFGRRQALGRLERLIDDIHSRSEATQAAPARNHIGYVSLTTGYGDERAMAFSGSTAGSR